MSKNHTFRRGTESYFIESEIYIVGRYDLYSNEEIKIFFSASKEYAWFLGLLGKLRQSFSLYFSLILNFRKIIISGRKECWGLNFVSLSQLLVMSRTHTCLYGEDTEIYAVSCERTKLFNLELWVQVLSQIKFRLIFKMCSPQWLYIAASSWLTMVTWRKWPSRRKFLNYLLGEWELNSLDSKNIILT